MPGWAKFGLSNEVLLTTRRNSLVSSCDTQCLLQPLVLERRLPMFLVDMGQSHAAELALPLHHLRHLLEGGQCRRVIEFQVVCVRQEHRNRRQRAAEVVFQCDALAEADQCVIATDGGGLSAC